MNKVEINFKGAVLDLKIELEGKEIRLYFDGSSNWSRVIKEFEIEGNLDVVMLCKGLNGTKWEMEIKVDDKGPIKYTGKITKGYSIKFDEINLPIG